MFVFKLIFPFSNSGWRLLGYVPVCTYGDLATLQIIECIFYSIRALQLNFAQRSCSMSHHSYYFSWSFANERVSLPTTGTLIFSEITVLWVRCTEYCTRDGTDRERKFASLLLPVVASIIQCHQSKIHANKKKKRTSRSGSLATWEVSSPVKWGYYRSSVQSTFQQLLIQLG